MSATPSRFTLNALVALAVISITEAFFGLLPYTALELTLSLALLLFATGTANALCVLFTKAVPHFESPYITALILFFIVAPIQSAHDAFVLIIVGAFAMFSKYLLAFRKVHIFNPAAIVILGLSIISSSAISWWIGTPYLFPFVCIAGYVVAQRIKRTEVILSFFLIVLVLTSLRLLVTGSTLLSLVPSVVQLVIATPLVFFATFLLTDPQTAPSTVRGRTWNIIITAFIYALSYPLAVVFGVFSATPMLGITIGNIFTFITEKYKQRRHILSFHSSSKLSKEVYEFSFLADAPIFFEPGQYMEIALPHESPDNRGVRRFFSITSSPFEHFVRFSTQIPVESSTFKDALLELKKGGQLFAANIAGSCTLPSDPNKKILAIAGGIGIAPFMSMFRHLALAHERRDIVLVYSAKTPLDFIYQDEIDSIKSSIGLRTIYLPLDYTELSDWKEDSGPITPEFIKKEVRDFNKREWYLSGSDMQIEEYAWIAEKLGIEKESITIYSQESLV